MAGIWNEEEWNGWVVVGRCPIAATYKVEPKSQLLRGKKKPLTSPSMWNTHFPPPPQCPLQILLLWITCVKPNLHTPLASLMWFSILFSGVLVTVLSDTIDVCSWVLSGTRRHCSNWSVLDCRCNTFHFLVCTVLVWKKFPCAFITPVQFDTSCAMQSTSNFTGLIYSCCPGWQKYGWIGGVKCLAGNSASLKGFIWLSESPSVQAWSMNLQLCSLFSLQLFQCNKCITQSTLVINCMSLGLVSDFWQFTALEPPSAMWHIFWGERKDCSDNVGKVSWLYKRKIFNPYSELFSAACRSHAGLQKKALWSRRPILKSKKSLMWTPIWTCECGNEVLHSRLSWFYTSFLPLTHPSQKSDQKVPKSLE